MGEGERSQMPAIPTDGPFSRGFEARIARSPLVEIEFT